MRAFWTFLSVALLSLLLSACSITDNFAFMGRGGQDRLEAPQEADAWYIAGQERLKEAKSARTQGRKAKNVILFVGDGMNVSTVTAARILAGQLAGKTGEEHVLSFERFPNVALSKTYNTNMQTPDSAGTATALVTGVKTKSGVISLDDAVERSKCGTGGQTQTILEMAELAGFATGVVTTTRLTHATPATNYAHSPNRHWENDTDVAKADNGGSCKDIAAQFAEFSVGDGIEVALGGGRAEFMPTDMGDPEVVGENGSRRDGRDLPEEWRAARPGSVYVWNQEQFGAIDVGTTEHLLGLFQPSHMNYEAERAQDGAGEPSLSEMTSLAIDMLAKNDRGFYLMVEGGRIDHAHHENKAQLALYDAVELARAVETALSKVDISETLIIVTADHAHTLSLAGYSVRGNPILGKAGDQKKGKLLKGLDGKPYTTLAYANGPGGWRDERPDITDVDTSVTDYRYQAMIPLYSESHSGEDVVIYAIGPNAHLIRGVVEQNYIFHVMRDAFGF